MERKKSVIVSIFLIFLMFGSTIAYTLLSAFRPEEENTGGNVSLPAKHIVYQELNESVENLALSEGMTIMKFYYNAFCNGCQEQKTYLEYMTNQNSDQVILVELTDNNANAPTVSITSQRGSDELVNATEEKVFDSLCSILIYPPVDCALEKI